MEKIRIIIRIGLTKRKNILKNKVIKDKSRNKGKENIDNIQANTIKNPLKIIATKKDIIKMRILIKMMASYKKRTIQSSIGKNKLGS